MLMAEAKQRVAAKKFVKDWSGKGYEKGESQNFGFNFCENFWV